MCIYMCIYCIGSEKFIDNVLSLADTEPSFIMCGVSISCIHTYSQTYAYTHIHTCSRTVKLLLYNMPGWFDYFPSFVNFIVVF